VRVVFVLALLSLDPPSSIGADSVNLWMPDGQLATNPVRLYVTTPVSLDMKPKLRLLGSHAITSPRTGEDDAIDPEFVAAGQSWIQPAVGKESAARTGSLLIFDLTSFPIPPFKSMMRLTPLLEWTENGIQRTAIAAGPVNLGNPVTAWITSGLVVAIVLVAILAMLGWHAAGIAIEDGRLSLSKVQIGAWTIAVGAIVFGHGLIQLDVPSIPESIVTLLGLSLATGGISYLQPNHGKVPPAPDSGGGAPDPDAPRWSFADLVSEDGVPSVSRAQMLFWTVLMVALFVVKSVLNGVVWEVPWAMVALMGISQVSYLAPKFVPEK
jgi:hypothetical protein